MRYNSKKLERKDQVFGWHLCQQIPRAGDIKSLFIGLVPDKEVGKTPGVGCHRRNWAKLDPRAYNMAVGLSLVR